jgi:acyl-coenzyme A thioesterase PaaI-like protein
LNDPASRPPGPRDPDALRRERAARRTQALRVDALPEWRRLSDAIRRQIAASLELDAEPEVLARLAEQAELLAAALEGRASGKRLALVDSAWEQNERAAMAYLPFSPVMGRLNPASFGIEIRRVGDKVVSEVELAEPAEGATGLVHGGVIAAIYDEVLAAANLMIKAGGPTGTLTVRYRKPTPLYARLRFEAWVDRLEDRKVHVHGHCLLGDERVTEAQAIFVRFAPDRPLSGWTPPGTGREEG